MTFSSRAERNATTQITGQLIFDWHFFRVVISSLILALLTPLILTGCRTTESAEDVSQPPQTLVVGVDGISFETFRRMQTEGKLPLFKPVAPMVASFPSISDPSWSLIMRVPKPAGYTKEYFDPTSTSPSGQGTEVGSILAHIEDPPLYEHGFDHRVHGIINHVANLAWLVTSARIWVEELPDHFFRMRQRKSYFAFTLNSDLISHTQGEAPVEDFLFRLERQLERITERMKTISSLPFEIIIVSDHGNQFFIPKMVQFEDVLKAKGWTRAEHLRNKMDFAFTAPEIISFGAFYTLPGNEARLALNLIQVPGMEVSLYSPDAATKSQTNTIRLLTESGRDEAEVTVDPIARTVLMKVLRGRDFFQQLAYFKKGPIDFDTYFKLSYQDPYPYVAVRAWEGFNSNCQFPGSVLAATEKNFAFGNPTIEILTAFKNLHSMHGGLRKEETWGIFASTQRALPAIRPQDFGSWVDLSEYHANLKEK